MTIQRLISNSKTMLDTSIDDTMVHFDDLHVLDEIQVAKVVILERK